ncbi:MAG: tRNA pseudouridine(38-40) synthase TruA [Bacteroidota bacterium]
MRYFIHLAYDGTRYHGWQIQPNAPTVQGTLQHALSTLIQQDTPITGAGRTDTGVHASDYYAHFDTVGSHIADTEDLTFRLNRFLPPDIVIRRIFPVPDSAHARFSALSRTYHYLISDRKPLFNRGYVHYHYGKTDLAAIRKCCEVVRNTTDFTSFSKLHSDNRTNICRIIHCEWIECEDGFRFEISADRFLRDMVRAITGTLLDVGAGRMGHEEFVGVIEARNRSAAGMSAPAQALFLREIRYPEGILP